MLRVFVEEGGEVEGEGGHLEFAGGGTGPLGLGAVDVEFDAVVVGVAEVEGFGDAVVGCAIEGDVVCDETAEGVCEFFAGGVEDGGVVEAGGAFGGGAGVFGVPGVEADVVVVVAGGEEGGGITEALGFGEAEDVAVEVEGAFEVCDFEVDVADAGFGVEGGNWWRSVGHEGIIGVRYR